MAARARPTSRRRSLAMHVAQQARPWWSRSHSRTRLSVMLCVIVTGPSPRLSCGECSTPVATRRSTPRGRAGRRLRRRLRAPPRWALLRRGRLGKGGRSLDGTWRRHGWRVGGLLTIGRLSAASVHRRRRRKLATGLLPGPARGRCVHQASGPRRSCPAGCAALLVPQVEARNMELNAFTARRADAFHDKLRLTD